MAGFLGMDFRSKAEKEKHYEEYTKKIFPYGEPQKERVTSLLQETFPQYRIKHLLLYYIMVKEEMIQNPSISFSDASGRIKKKRAVVRVTPELEAVLETVISCDLKIDENLSYPSVESIKIGLEL